MSVDTSILNNDVNTSKIDRLISPYSDSKMIEVLEMSPEGMDMIPSDYMSGSNRLMLWVSGNDERFCINTLYDNLGKGASGAAVQCMNIMLGISEEEGLL